MTPYDSISWKYLFINLLITRSAVQFHCTSLDVKEGYVWVLFGWNKILIKKIFSYSFSKLFVNHKFFVFVLFYMTSGIWFTLILNKILKNGRVLGITGNTDRGHSMVGRSRLLPRGRRVAVCSLPNSHPWLDKLPPCLQKQNNKISRQTKPYKQKPKTQTQNPRGGAGFRLQKQGDWIQQFPSLPQAGQAPRGKW